MKNKITTEQFNKIVDLVSQIQNVCENANTSSITMWLSQVMPDEPEEETGLEYKMGGSLAVAIREEDGSEHRMNRWTNSMPFFIKNMALINKDQEHLKEYLQTWYNFREDFLNAKDGNFKLNMTPVYADHPFLAPSEYGQVVVDYKENKILSCQNYSNISEISRISIVNELEEGSDFWTDKYSMPYLARELYEAGRLSIKHRFVKRENEKYDEPIKMESITDSQSFLDYLLTKNPHIEENNSLLYHAEAKFFWPETYAAFVIDMHPFEVIEFSRDANGLEEMKKAIVELGFSLSKEEEDIWDEYIQEYVQE